VDEFVSEPEVDAEASEKPYLQIAAALVALVGLADSIYLTVHHFTAAPVPCTLTGGCEMVLTSSWAEIYGVPLAAFGAAAYFTAFSLAVLAAYGDRRMWSLFGIVAAGMAGFSLYLVYLQAFVIKAFCQFCLISAGSSITLFVIFILYLLMGRKILNP
jgi:uncharacterized membrane protein